MHTLLYIYLIGVIATLIISLIILATDDIRAINNVWTWIAYALLWPIKLLKALYDVIYDIST